MITQEEMLSHFYSHLKSQGKKYKKRSLIKAKKAKLGLVVVTRTSDGEETRNTAEEGDWLVENQTSAEEKYLVKAETFEKKYTLRHSIGDGWGCYSPKGEIYAKEMTAADLAALGAQDILEFQAPWKETVIIKPGDYLVIPTDKSEIYRIARKEFGETYEVVKE